MGHRLVVQKDDTLVVEGWEVEASVLAEIIKPDKRVLWAFVKSEDGQLQPVPYTEDRVVWLQDGDLERTEDPA